MKKALISPLGLDAKGAGPSIFRMSVPLLLAGIVCQWLFPEICHYSRNYPSILTWAGFGLILAGFILYVASMVQLLRHFSEGKLITGGLFRFSRNPLYVAWMLFIFPGISLAADNWIFLAADLAFAIAFGFYIRKEEQCLESVFGEEYKKYAEKVGRVISLPRI